MQDLQISSEDTDESDDADGLVLYALACKRT